MIVVLHAAHYASEGQAASGPVGRAVLWVMSKLGSSVPIFFVISGYCIAATSDSSRRKPRAPLRFFVRRFRRIFPPYWIFVLITLALVVSLTALGRGDLVSSDYGLIPHPARLSWSQWVGNLTLTETWRPNLFGDAELKIIGPAWTLCYEEQFYAVCALLLLVSPRHFFSGVAAVTLLTLTLVPWSLSPEGQVVRGFFFDGRWLMFAEGVAVYYLLNYSRTRWFGVAFFAVLLVILVALRMWPLVAANELYRNRVWELIASTAFTIVALLLRPWDERFVQSRLSRPLAVCGRMCYSLYLVHWPITVVIASYFHGAGVRGLWPTLMFVAPLGIVASIVSAWLFHRAVETRFLNSPATTVPDAKARVDATDQTPTNKSKDSQPLPVTAHE